MSKKYIWLLISFLLFLLLLFLPYLASTKAGTKILMHYAEKKIDAKIEVGKLRLSWFGPQEISHFHAKGKEYVIGFDQLRVSQPLWRSIRLLDGNWKSFTGSFSLQNASIYVDHPSYPEVEVSELFAEAERKKSNWQIDAKANISAPSGKQGFFSLRGNSDLARWNDLTCNLDLSFSHLPTYFLQVVKNGPFLAALMGDTADGKATLSMQKGKGRLDASIDSESLRTDIFGKIENGILTLRKNLIAQFYLTENLSNYLFKEINPFFVTAISADHPVQLLIHKNGFSFPLSFDTNQLVIDRATLDMGKIRCQNGSTLSLAISLLKMRSLLGQRTMTVWFNPLDFSIKDQIITCQRMDMLIADVLHFCTWGKINLKNKKIRMTLGITQSALAHSFGLTNLPKEYVLTIPIRGTTKKPDIDLSKGAAKIAALMAKDKAGFFGKWIPTEEKEIPPPIYPIPWEGKISPRKNNFWPDLFSELHR